MTRREAARNQSASCSWPTGGRNRTTSAMPRRAASFCRPSGLARPLPLGPPTTGTRMRERSSGRSSRRTATARSSTSGAFRGWMRPAKSGISASWGRPRRARAAARPSAGGAGQVHAGVDHGELVQVGGVVLCQVVGLFGGVGDEAVGGGDDLGLADDAGGGLGAVAVGQVGVLDLGHGVHGVHQGDAPALGGEPADVAGEPVVGVDQVVVAGAVVGPCLHDAVGEGAQLGGEVLLVEALVGAGVDVPDQRRRGPARRWAEGRPRSRA
ncbi:hypothetical protein SPURM210S_06586 [Streptomyces purpurascens]